MVKCKHGRKPVRLKAIIRNFTILNMILLLITVLFTFAVFLPKLEIRVKYALPPIKDHQETEKEVMQTEGKTPSVTEYASISEKNLFSPERKIPAEKKGGDQQSLPTPDFLLYGTLLSSEIKLAYIEDLKAIRNTPGRGRRQAALKIGDSLSGFTLKEIHADSIVMSRGGETVTVRIADNPEKKTRTFQAAPQPKSEQPSPPASPRARGALRNPPR